MKKIKNSRNYVGAGPVSAQNGITLIALIITIIAMLILVSVTISMAVNGGLFDYAGKAVSETQNAIGKEQQLANGEIKIGDTWYNSIDDYLKGVESVKSLQEKHEFTYYSSLVKAVTDVNNNTRANSDSDKENAVAGVYTDNGKTTVVLLKDATETKRVEPSVDMTINLGGHTLLFENDYFGIIGAANHTDTIKIDGRLNGSTIILNGIDGGGQTITTRKNTFIINGGLYKVNETKRNEEYSACAISVSKDGIADIKNCNLISESAKGKALALLNEGKTVISNCDVRGYSNYNYGDGTYSSGVNNDGTITINECYVIGTQSGVQNSGTVYVNGGTYEGYGYGGFLFEGEDIHAYVRNAKIRECAMPDGYVPANTSQNIGFYIGSTNDGVVGKNMSVYMDNCDVYGSSQSFVFAGSSGEQNNRLYISNSRINTDKKISIENDTHKLYIGKGNNFTVDNTNRASAVVETQEVYIQK